MAALSPSPSAPAADRRDDPEGPGSQDARPGAAERWVTLGFVTLPAVALVLAVIQWWGHGVGARELAVGAIMYVFAGFGITAGYHRMLAHHSFRSVRPLKIALSVLGSMAFQGGPIGWVADHRRHHRFSDTAGDPHSPVANGPSTSRLRGLAHAHVGWLFNHSPTRPERYARDLLHDRDLVVVDRLFPLWCAVSLAIPFVCGYLLGGGWRAAWITLLWAGGLRVFVQHHVTWSINSICHTFGARPFRTNDHSGNVAWLAVASLGESWHNGHHALPRSARHGLLPHQPDATAGLIRIFERLGLATAVVWPRPDQVRDALERPIAD